MPPVIDEQKCVRCGTCANICNSAILLFDRKSPAPPQVVFPEECWHCEACVVDCPADAIHMRFPLAYSLMYVASSTLKPEEQNRARH